MNDLIALVNEQAEDPGLWCLEPTIAEHMLQQALRNLHAAVEAQCSFDSTAQWQSMDTAPKDGTQVDLYVQSPNLSGDSGGRVTQCWHSQDRWWRYDDSKYATDLDYCRSEVWHITHWMPLPASPVSRPHQAPIEKTEDSQSC